MTSRSARKEAARRRVDDFEAKFGKEMLHLAYHAALPVALDAGLLHFLRINFFWDPSETLPPWAESDLLLSSLCHEVDDGLYEIESDVRDVLLEELVSERKYGHDRIREVATLLWQYSTRYSPWVNRPLLERAQQLTALNFLDSEKALRWLEEAENQSGLVGLEGREWFVAMREEVEKREEALSWLAGEPQVAPTLEESVPVSDRGRVQAQLQAVLDLLRTLDAGREVALFVEQRRPRVTVSTRLGEFGWQALTVGMLNTIFIAPNVLDLTRVQAVPLYAHEFGHLLFGKDRPVECTIDSIEQEYAAESLAARVWVEMNPDAPPEEYERQAGWILDQPVETAYQAMRQWGPYYAGLPEKQPRWYQAGQYWPTVQHILRIALGM